MKTDSYWPNELCEEKIYRYSDTVYRLAYALVKNRHDADDIHQEVFVRYITNQVPFKMEVLLRHQSYRKVYGAERNQARWLWF